MLKGLAVFAVLVGVAQIGVEVPRQGGYQQDHAAHDADTANPNRPLLTQFAAEFRPIIQETKWEGKSNSPDQEPGYWKQAVGPPYAAAWALVIVGGIAGIAAWVTLLDIRRLAETAARNTDATITGQRPWILVKRIGNPPDGLVDPQNPHFNPGIGIQFQVYGNTPAEITDSKFCLQIVKRGRSFPPVPDLPAVPDYSMAASNPDLPAMMVMRPPRDRFNVIFTLPQPLTTAELEELQYQRTFLCAWGFIKYRDVFGGEGETSVCYIYDFANGGVLSTLDGIRLNPPGFRVGGPRSYNHTK